MLVTCKGRAELLNAFPDIQKSMHSDARMNGHAECSIKAV
jgi:hypothetical protein